MSDIVAGLRASPSVVIEAPPGAGKTTRVPRAFLDGGFADAGVEGGGGEILVLEPRRLPARLAAARVAGELGEEMGERVGYTVRFDSVGGPRTRLRFLTEGVFIRRLIADPRLDGVSVVVLDEFHERHLATDLALGLARRLQRGDRPDLKLCVMSATLEADAIARYLGDCPRLRSEGRRFDVRIEHLPETDDRPVAVQVTAAVRRALREQTDGDVLVFLAGAAEIRRCQEALDPVARASDLEVAPLHGDLPLPEQMRVVTPGKRRKIILSTNVAETSVTIEGVTVVIDSGWARVAGHSPWTGLPTLALQKISQASAIQRAGRAGRTREGLALRLYTRHDFEGRPAHDVPETGRSDLAEALLTLRAAGVPDPGRFDWLTPPPPAAVAAGEELLLRLGAVEATAGGANAGRLTKRGRRLLRFPVHPRLARALVEAEDRGVADEMATVAALIAERDVREQRHNPFGATGGGGARRSGPGAGGQDRGGDRGGDRGIDLIALLEMFELARQNGFARDRLRSLGLHPAATAAADQLRRQLAALLPKRSQNKSAAASGRHELDRALCRATLAGFPDRVARRRDGTARTVLLAAGGSAELGYQPDSELIVALDAEERARDRRAGPGGATTTIRLGCGIEADWLAELEGDGLRVSDALEMDDTGERVVRRSRLSYDQLTLDETVRPAEPSAETTRVLAEAAIARGADTFDEPGALTALAARLAVLAEAYPEAGIARLDEAAIRAALIAACQGLRSFSDLRQIPLGDRVVTALPPPVRALLAAEAPARITLPGGRAVTVHYDHPGQPPWIESRLQDFFGSERGPAIAGGRVPLTLHLLAPNGRAVQVTRDLANFWRQHYPPLRRELGRRYPRHAWPEDGRTASPPPPTPRRR